MTTASQQPNHSFVFIIDLSSVKESDNRLFCFFGIMAKEDIVKYQFTSDQSRTIAAQNGRKGGIRSGEVKRENKLIKDRILERMGETDWNTMIDNLIERASADTKSFEVLRDTIGQKPTEHIEADVNSVIRVTLDD